MMYTVYTFLSNLIQDEKSIVHRNYFLNSVGEAAKIGLIKYR